MKHILLPEAEFSVDQNAKWFRPVMTDRQGFKAYTNAYFTDMLRG